jgi:hypothetical protein
MVRIYAAQVRNGLGWWTVVPLSSSFGDSKPSDQQHVLKVLANCARHSETLPVAAVIIAAWRNEGRMHFLASDAYNGPLPKLSCLELFADLTHIIECDDPMLIRLLAGPDSEWSQRSHRRPGTTIHRRGESK